MSAGYETDHENSEEWSLEEQEYSVKGLDPKLYDVLEAWRAAEPVELAAVRESERQMVVDVFAELEDPDQEVPGLNVERKSGPLVTATVEVSQIESVRTHPNVKGLKLATSLHTELKDSLPEIRATPAQLQAALPHGPGEIDGAGVIVGIVDTGCDFVHKNFRKLDDTTRLLCLWDQAGTGDPPPPDGFRYGREFDAAAINKALRAADPHEALGYGPSGPRKDRAHGTHVMDIAAGNGRVTGRPGVAPKADLIFVEVSPRDYGAEESFGNSKHLAEAVMYIFERAKGLGKPAVVNISLGTHGGPHDGSTYAERVFDQLLQTPGRAIVISAGNSRGRRSHASGRIEAGGKRTLTWEILQGDMTNNEMEIWYDVNHRLEVTIITPSGGRLGPMSLNQRPMRITKGGKKLGRITHQKDDYGDNRIDILFDRSLLGKWGVELSNVGSQRAGFHAWIERDDRGQSRFAEEDDDTATTIGSISCGEHTIVVGSYDARRTDMALSVFSAEGPTRDGRRKPEASAPGHNVYAARSLSQGNVCMSGTSMAAPHVTGLVALLMQAAGRELTITEVRDAVLETARKKPPSRSGWHARYGNGRVDCVSTLLAGSE
jgi:subtilisin family serine protease